MKIRKARRADIPEIRRLIYELAVYEKAPGEVKLTRRDLERTLFAREPKVFCDLLETGGRIAGLAVWFLNYSTWQGKHGIYLEDLFVRPEFRGRGYGEALLRRLARICVKKGCGRFQWSVLDWNEPAIKFYKKLGAAALDEWTGYRVSGPALKKLAGRRGASGTRR